jgi:2-oxoglutarate ferredoxin oxidoreductase subunit beta
MHPIAEKYLRKSALPMIFCPGCGHGTVLNAFLRAVDDLGIIDCRSSAASAVRAGHRFL